MTNNSIWPHKPLPCISLQEVIFHHFFNCKYIRSKLPDCREITLTCTQKKTLDISLTRNETVPEACAPPRRSSEIVLPVKKERFRAERAWHFFFLALSRQFSEGVKKQVFSLFTFYCPVTSLRKKKKTMNLRAMTCRNPLVLRSVLNSIGSFFLFHCKVVFTLSCP